MELRQLSYFVAVAEERQFTRAAVRMSVAQPAVSAQIRILERELGEALFHRDRRAVSLTDAGEALLPHARAALAAAERGRDTIASLRGMLHGRLRVGLQFAGPVDHRLAETLGDFHRAHPAIEIVLTNHHRAPLVRAVAAGDVDVAVLGIGYEPLPPELRARQVATEPVVLGVRRDHPLGRRKAIALADLRDQPMIALTHESALRRLLERACRDAGFSPRITAETGELRSLVDLAAAGLGVAVAPPVRRGERRPRGSRDHAPAPSPTHGTRLERLGHLTGGARLPGARQRTLRLTGADVSDGGASPSCNSLRPPATRQRARAERPSRLRPATDPCSQSQQLCKWR